MFKLPQEIEFFYIIPKIRSIFAKRMLKEGYSYEEIAKNLGITKTSVNNYLKEKRAKNIKFSKEIEEEIEKSLKKVIEKKSNFLIESQNILKLIREKKFSCFLCKKYNKDVFEYCREKIC
ncbi:MAG: helix-turn-helix domain-containing protein [Candidatus Pacearchaeota archaeon]